MVFYNLKYFQIITLSNSIFYFLFFQIIPKMFNFLADYFVKCLGLQMMSFDSFIQMSFDSFIQMSLNLLKLIWRNLRSTDLKIKNYFMKPLLQNLDLDLKKIILFLISYLNQYLITLIRYNFHNFEQTHFLFLILINFRQQVWLNFSTSF